MDKYEVFGYYLITFTSIFNMVHMSKNISTSTSFMLGAILNQYIETIVILLVSILLILIVLLLLIFILTMNCESTLFIPVINDFISMAKC